MKNTTIYIIMDGSEFAYTPEKGESLDQFVGRIMCTLERKKKITMHGSDITFK